VIAKILAVTAKILAVAELDDTARKIPQVPYAYRSRSYPWARRAIERAEAEHGRVRVRKIRDGVYEPVIVTRATGAP
jgi:hypothetical protein